MVFCIWHRLNTATTRHGTRPICQFVDFTRCTSATTQHIESWKINVTRGYQERVYRFSSFFANSVRIILNDIRRHSPNSLRIIVEFPFRPNHCATTLRRTREEGNGRTNRKCCGIGVHFATTAPTSINKRLMRNAFVRSVS